MKYASFTRPDSSSGFGRINGDRIDDLTAADGQGPASLKSALAAGTLTALPATTTWQLDEISLLPVIPDPGKILCVGLNYASHIEETGRREGKNPVIFTRFADTLVAHGEAIICPAVSHELDYEGELALVIGKGGYKISEADAMQHVAGYTCFNDASVRDWQMHTSQYTPGKNFPATGGFGPFLVTPDEIPDLPAQRVVTRLNGVVVQDQPVADLIFPIPFLIAYISSFTPLAAGDVIVTGTPGGVGFMRKPPLWMKDGDTVEVSVGAVGTLINPVVKEASL